MNKKNLFIKTIDSISIGVCFGGTGVFILSTVTYLKDGGLGYNPYNVANITLCGFGVGSIVGLWLIHPFFCICTSIGICGSLNYKMYRDEKKRLN